MSKKAAVLLAEGFEEVEALAVVDVLRRAGITCHTVSTGGEYITSSHQVTIKADELLSEAVTDYDLVAVPGGLPGATNLRDDARVIDIIKTMNDSGKLLCAMCAGPIVLGKAGVLDGKNYTCYPGFNEKMETTGKFHEDLVVRDGNVITSRGPATAWAFAYKILEALGEDSSALKEGMLYNLLMQDAKNA